MRGAGRLKLGVALVLSMSVLTSMQQLTETV